MARIVIDARRLRSTTGRYARELLTALEDLELTHDIQVIAHQDDRGSWTSRSFPVHYVAHDWYSMGEQLGLAQVLRRLRPDLVHFTMPQQPLAYAGARITTVQDLTLLRFDTRRGSNPLHSFKRTAFRVLLRNVARRSRLIITPSEFTGRDLAEFAQLDPAVIRTIPDAAFALPETEAEQVDALAGRSFIFHVGNAFPHKNLDRLVEAHQRLLDQHPDVYLVLAGKRDHFHTQLESHAARMGADRFMHLGYITDSQLVWLYRNAVAYVLPSLSEGFGLPGLEAMQYRTPLLSSNATCLPEVYGDAAHYFDPEDVADMQRAIGEVVADAALRADLVAKGAVRVGRFSWQNTARQTVLAYEEALT